MIQEAIKLTNLNFPDLGSYLTSFTNIRKLNSLLIIVDSLIILPITQISISSLKYQVDKTKISLHRFKDKIKQIL